MKRFLHALAALWPKKRATGSPPDPDTGSGIQEHLDAVLRMERALCEFADLAIREFAEETVGAGALNTVRDQLTESSVQQLNESPDTRLPESPDTRLPASPDTRLPESPDTRLPASPDTRLPESPDTRLDDSPNQQIVESPNQPQSPPRIPQPMPLLTILMLVFFMCLMAAKQVSAQAEPAEAAYIKDLDTERTSVSKKNDLPKITTELYENEREKARILKKTPMADLNRFPLMKYRIDSSDFFVGLSIGDTIPDTIWDLPLWAVNTPGTADTISLRTFKDSKLIVLDFWASWCAPCVGSMDKWESYANELNNGVKLIGVHLDFDYKALPFAQHKQWKSPQVIGEGAYILNRHFFDRDVISRMAWIQDGKLIAITSGRGYDLQTVADVVARRPVDIPMDYNWTYQPDNPGKP